MLKNNFRAIILAAGLGLRLNPLTKEIPKALMSVAGQPLIAHAINFLKGVGVSDIIVVGGFGFEKLQKTVKEIDSDIEVIKNSQFQKGNLLSLMTALPYINTSFLLSNVDHIYKVPIRKLVASQCRKITAFCDFDRKLGEDDMKVKIEGDRLLKISKTLNEFDGGYVGLTYCDKKYLPQYLSAVKEVQKKKGEMAVVEDVLDYLAQNTQLIKSSDISGCGWLEIDTPEELVRANDIVKDNSKDFSLWRQ